MATFSVRSLCPNPTMFFGVYKVFYLFFYRAQHHSFKKVLLRSLATFIYLFRPITRDFDVFFDLRPNNRFSKQSRGWWFETPSGSLWRHCNDFFQKFSRLVQCPKGDKIIYPYCNVEATVDSTLQLYNLANCVCQISLLKVIWELICLKPVSFINI